MKQRVIACTLSVVLLYPAFVAVSQTKTGSLSGMVSDALGFALPKLKVLATRVSDRSATFETRTNDSGRFTFTNLPPDVYQVSVVREDIGATMERSITVRQGQTAELEIQFGTGCDNVPKGEGAATDEDKAEVFMSMLKEVTAPRMGLLERRQRETGIVLSTENIKPNWVQGLQGLRIQLLTPGEIQRKADSEGDFLFLSVPEMKVRGQCIAITMSNSWAKAADSKTEYMSGGGFIYEYRKQSGKWVGKVVTGWVV